MTTTPNTQPKESSTAVLDPVLQARGIAKHFGAVTALDGVDFHVDSGEIVGLVGDNGAGKSTLIKVLSGVHHPDDGEILIDGKAVQMANPREAQSHGIETVHQDLTLFDELSISANIFAGREMVSLGGLLKEGEMRTYTKELVTRLGVDLPSSKSIVKNLSGGQRQAVALARAVGFGSRVVLLDEPTSALSKAAAEHVLDVIRDLRRQDIATIFIGHNLEHVMDVCDRIVVLRHGTVAGSVKKSDYSITGLVSLMVGG